MEAEIKFSTMPVYVINLDRRGDRWKKFMKQPLYNYFKGIERFSAFDGQHLEWEHDERISIHTRDNIAINFRRSHHEINTLGACGASLSHIGCWKKFLETDEEHCMILEDDTKLDDTDFAKAILYAKRIPSNFDIWLLGCHFGSYTGEPYAKGSPWQTINRFTGAQSYLITRKAAEMLLKECFPIETHIEFYISSCVKLNKMVMLKHNLLRITQIVEDTLVNDSDTVAIQTCPLCKVPDNPVDTYYLLPIKGVLQALMSITAVGFVFYGYYRAKKLS
jgi:GR25 family glycosyltransferase involved in LPS biosynthesis